MRTSMTATWLLVAAVSAPAGAQSTTTHIAVSGGVATDQSGVRSNAIGLAPGVTVEQPNLALQLGGNATRYATGVFSFGGGVSLTADRPITRFVALTALGSAGATRLEGSTAAAFAQADALPALELRVSRLALFGGLRAAIGSAPKAAVPGLPLGGTGSANVSRAGAGPVFGGAVVIGNEKTALRLGAREERLQIEHVSAPERSLNAALSVALTRSASLELAAGRYDANRLWQTPAGDYASVGVSLRFGGARETSLPGARGAPQAPPGTTRLSIRAPDARRVEIAGDFNEWTPASALRANNGVWYADLKIPPGQYRYAFRVNGVEWRVPDGATAVDDGLGGKSAWVTVSETRSKQ